ncbi:MAG: diadenylate cyclase CdaA [Planctomycetota bacterium]|nr:diadenylate cyclase CdaA [Planctomycetota bacterium]
MPTEGFSTLLQRLANYPWWQVGVELLIIGAIVYGILRFVRGSRAAGALKGLLVILIVVTLVSRVFTDSTAFQRLAYLNDRFLALVAIALVVIFQPELRRALVRLGETPFFRTTPKELALIAEEIAEACAYLSKNKFGALIVLEREIGLAGIVEGGTPLNANLSARLLQTIFFPGSALHDLAVIVKGRTIVAASVQLPLAEPGDMPDTRLGSRHRAALGLSKECDAVIIVVSEETGRIRIAERGTFSDPIPHPTLGSVIIARLSRGRPDAPTSAVRREPPPLDEPGAFEGNPT